MSSTAFAAFFERDQSRIVMSSLAATDAPVAPRMELTTGRLALHASLTINSHHRAGSLEKVMAITGIGGAPSIQSQSQQVSQSQGHHKHHGHKSSSISDVDAQSSSLSSGGGSNSPGGKVNITV
jgi:hypothetical protein